MLINSFGDVELTSSTILIIFGCIVTSKTQSIPFNQESLDLLSWEAPLEIQRNYPYFLAGKDKEGSPVWIVEFGKWDVRNSLENQLFVDELDKWSEQMWERMSTPLEGANMSNSAELEFTGITDLDGYSLNHYSHLPTVQKQLKMVRHFSNVVNRKGNFKKAIVINSNFLFQSLWNILKPILGGTASNIEMYGTNSATWKPILLRSIDKDQLPEWLGGSPDWKPLQVYG